MRALKSKRATAGPPVAVCPRILRTQARTRENISARLVPAEAQGTSQFEPGCGWRKVRCQISAAAGDQLARDRPPSLCSYRRRQLEPPPAFARTLPSLAPTSRVPHPPSRLLRQRHSRSQLPPLPPVPLKRRILHPPRSVHPPVEINNFSDKL